MIRASRKVVDATPDLLVAAEADGQHVRIANRGSKVLILGPKGLTKENGYEMLTTENPIDIDLGPGDELWGVCKAAEETTAHILEAGST